MTDQVRAEAKRIVRAPYDWNPECYAELVATIATALTRTRQAAFEEAAGIIALANHDFGKTKVERQLG